VVNVTKDIIQLIQNFSGENTDPNSLVAMLSNLIELSQFFDHNNINDLF
jgi:DNA gyrase/topoisomerase IV subunit A